MISKRIQEKGILAKLLEKAIKILLKKECKKIGKLKIDIIASSIQIIKGIIQKINIIAEDINYKDLLFDEIILEANKVKIIFKINNKELKFNNNLRIKLKITISENSLKKILFSKNWKWLGNMITKEISNQDELIDIKIENNQIIIKASNAIKTINEGENINIKKSNGKLYLENKNNNKSIKIPIEDKVFIKNVNIRNNLINIFANSSVSY